MNDTKISPDSEDKGNIVESILKEIDEVKEETQDESALIPNKEIYGSDPYRTGRMRDDGRPEILYKEKWLKGELPSVWALLKTSTENRAFIFAVGGRNIGFMVSMVERMLKVATEEGFELSIDFSNSFVGNRIMLQCYLTSGDIKDELCYAL